MPIIKSAIKRARQSLVRRSRNLQVKRAIKRDVSDVHTAIATADQENMQSALAGAYSQIDRAVKKGTLHKNTAARRKSNLAHAVAKATGAEATPAETKTTKGAGRKAVTAKAAPAKKAPAKTALAKKTRAAKTETKKTEKKTEERSDK